MVAHLLGTLFVYAYRKPQMLAFIKAKKKKKSFYKSFVTPGPQNQSHASILRFIHQLRAE